jgi:hypothetical protein
MNDLDVLAFTGGIGEQQAPVRAEAAPGWPSPGVAIDPARNEAATDDADILAFSGGARTVVVTARKDVEIARQVRAAPIWATGVKRALKFSVAVGTKRHLTGGRRPRRPNVWVGRDFWPFRSATPRRNGGAEASAGARLPGRRR